MDAKASGWTGTRVAVVAGAVPAAIGASLLYAWRVPAWTRGSGGSQWKQRSRGACPRT